MKILRRASCWTRAPLAVRDAASVDPGELRAPTFEVAASHRSDLRQYDKLHA
ncbi:hypothetical protein [Arthrobacter pascens]|uniref:hypothetical protein n=1 Tax=Arthrobacter pascens TaxID=1677 RepID=UPI00196ABA66|nr:hypothetical protein [Arthrobacter pascens]MBN3499500.1 hypothetical protein [Arthrobacter pascens]